MCLAVTAAEYLINKTINNGEKTETSPLNYYKLHKLLYFAQGYMLAHHNKKLFQEEIIVNSCGVFISSFSIENGVVQQTGGLDPIYMRYKENEIRKPTTNPYLDLLSKDREKVLDRALKDYGDKTEDELTIETREHSIYKNSYKTNKKDNSTASIIGVEDIRKFFKENLKI